ncbi:hypothetical protein BGZ94_000016 [Podila epigama]|nr:hypothetical protein BGZ94_000016 [Podila epigama]
MVVVRDNANANAKSTLELLQDLLQDPLLADISTMHQDVAWAAAQEQQQQRQQQQLCQLEQAPHVLPPRSLATATATVSTTTQTMGNDRLNLDPKSVKAMLTQVDLMIQAEQGSACRAILQRVEHDPIDSTVKELKRQVQFHIEKESRRKVLQARQLILDNLSKDLVQSQPPLSALERVNKETEMDMDKERVDFNQSTRHEHDNSINSKMMDSTTSTSKKLSLPPFTSINW